MAMKSVVVGKNEHHIAKSLKYGIINSIDEGAFVLCNFTIQEEGRDSSVHICAAS